MYLFNLGHLHGFLLFVLLLLLAGLVDVTERSFLVTDMTHACLVLHPRL